MEFCIPAWSPYLEKNIACLERVQRRETKLIHGLWNKSYDESLRFLGLYSLQTRRLIRGILLKLLRFF